MAFYASHIQSFYPMGATSAALFTAHMLSGVEGVLNEVEQYLQSRLRMGSTSGYAELAAQSAESSLNLMGAWPRPYGRGGQVQQMETLYEDLLEEQRKSVLELARRHEQLREEVTDSSAALAQNAEEVVVSIKELAAKADTTHEAVNAEKTRIDTVVTDGQDAINDIKKENQANYEAFLDDRRLKFEDEVQPIMKKISAELEEAEEKLKRLRIAEHEFANLSSAAANDKLSRHFAQEAKTSRWVGIGSYVLGLLLLGAGATPLVTSALGGGTGEENWPHFLTRLAIALVAGSAATVTIRLGSRFIESANVSKRMELEMRTFGPFLENVTDKDAVDAARIELIDRSFGKTFGSSQSDKNEPEALPVSTFTQILAAVSRVAGRS
ncbi:hypothetical protein GTU71_02460 [Rathayibacter sp. VKM Ac-2762]|uniref:hypothetical protein n=1 Tax=Rathayibacter sp. VKM Ac-2762 TaxID=2609254 RepID=UPI00132EBED8|nr:hypothetical protein [Rathayibacter sp. VKM Ac-2762]QHF19831.1 hypothetical protein GTU71_02460 [Rathayibacter sp. VKM Ac-2762]